MSNTPQGKEGKLQGKDQLNIHSKIKHKIRSFFKITRSSKTQARTQVILIPQYYPQVQGEVLN